MENRADSSSCCSRFACALNNLPFDHLPFACTSAIHYAYIQGTKQVEDNSMHVLNLLVLTASLGCRRHDASISELTMPTELAVAAVAVAI